MFYRNRHLIRRYRRVTMLISCAVLIMLLIRPPSAAAQMPTKVEWFAVLGDQGQNDQQIATEKRVIQEFNNTIGKQDNIELDIQIGGAGQTFDPVQLICTMIKAGYPPDIVGPISVSRSNVTGDCGLSGYWMGDCKM